MNPTAEVFYAQPQNLILIQRIAIALVMGAVGAELGKQIQHVSGGSSGGFGGGFVRPRGLLG